MTDERDDKRAQDTKDRNTVDEKKAETIQLPQDVDEQATGAYWTEERQRTAKPRPFPIQPSPSDYEESKMQRIADRKAEVVQLPYEAEQTVEELSVYWTEERMKRARPRPMPSAGELITRAREEDAWPTSTDPISSEEGVQAALPYETTLVPHSKYRQLPYSAVGKLFMTFDGVDAYGSAWAVAHFGVFTAGHCLYDPGLEPERRWARNVLFRLQYYHGSGLGDWVPAAGEMWVSVGWGEYGDLAYDLAVFKTTRRMPNRLGTMANYEPDQGPYVALGYPAEPSPGYPFDGEAMWQSVGDYISGGKDIVTAHNNMTGGSSGGPWVVTRRPNYVNGINSHTIDDGTMSTPYLGRAFVNLRNHVRDPDMT